MQRLAPKVVIMKPLKMSDFRALRDLVYRQAGIHLADSKHALVEARLARRVRELALPSYRAYLELLLSGTGHAELVRMLDCVTTNETRFFREPKHFEFLEQCVFPIWREQAASRARPKRIRAWSAACSSGEEPYSLAMCLLRAFPKSDGWELEVLASDLSTRMLERARQATWPFEKVDEIPQPMLRQFMLQGIGPEEGKLRCAPELREVVNFSRQNLNHPPFDVPRDLDLIFCRNVFIYFDQASKVRAVDGLLDRLDRNGYLFIGQSETLHGVTQRTRVVAPSVYQHRLGSAVG